MQNRIGLAGMGRMGTAMAERLITCGQTVAVWNRTRAKSEPLAALGAQLCETPPELVAQSECTISVVTEDHAARSLYLDVGGLFDGAVAGKYFIDMSTLKPVTVREIAAAAEVCGAHFISAPVLGTNAQVRQAQLVVLASGRIEDLEHVRGILDLMARKVVHLGVVGSSAAMKLAVNLVLGVYLEALAEALALGASEGLEPPAMLDVLADSPMANFFLAFKMPILKGATANAAFDMKSLCKDLSSAVSAAAETGVSLPAATACVSSLKAGMAAGWGERDIAELPLFYRKHMQLSW